MGRVTQHGEVQKDILIPESLHSRLKARAGKDKKYLRNLVIELLEAGLK